MAPCHPPSRIHRTHTLQLVSIWFFRRHHHYCRRRSSSKVVQLFAHSSRERQYKVREPTNDLWLWNFMKFWVFATMASWCVCEFHYRVTFDCGAVQLSVSLNTNAHTYIYSFAGRATNWTSCKNHCRLYSVVGYYSNSGEREMGAPTHSSSGDTIRASGTPNPCRTTQNAIVLKTAKSEYESAVKSFVWCLVAQSCEPVNRSIGPLAMDEKKNQYLRMRRIKWIMCRLHQNVDILFEQTTVRFTSNWNIYWTEYGCCNNGIDTVRGWDRKIAHTTAKLYQRNSVDFYAPTTWEIQNQNSANA